VAATDLTSNIRNQAGKAGVPTVGVTETIQPVGATFEQWFTNELVQLRSALAHA